MAEILNLVPGEHLTDEAEASRLDQAYAALEFLVADDLVQLDVDAVAIRRQVGGGLEGCAVGDAAGEHEGEYEDGRAKQGASGPSQPASVLGQRAGRSTDASLRSA